MIITGKHLSRRTMLRGMGAALALPLLDGMVPAFAAAPPPVRRFGAIYVGMGMNMRIWAQDVPGQLEMNPILAPLESFRDRMVVVSGLDNIQALSNADAGQHPRAQSSWLTGARAKKTDGPDIHLGVSLDQIIARPRSYARVLISLRDAPSTINRATAAPSASGSEKGTSTPQLSASSSCAYQKGVETTALPRATA